MQVSLIAAVAQNGTIGRDNQLPWNIREEMQFFVRTTRGHVVITGRKNFEAMGGPLENRIHAVVSRNPAYQAPGCHVSTTIEDALRFAEAQGETEVFVIGGAEIYALAFPYAHCIYKTTVLADVPGDVKFPNLPVDDWKREVIGRGAKSDVNEHAFIIERLLRPDAHRNGARKGERYGAVRIHRLGTVRRGRAPTATVGEHALRTRGCRAVEERTPAGT